MVEARYIVRKCLGKRNVNELNSMFGIDCLGKVKL